MAGMLHMSTRNLPRNIIRASKFLQKSRPQVSIHLQERYSHQGKVSLCWLRRSLSTSNKQFGSNLHHRNWQLNGVRNFRSTTILCEDKIVTVPPFAESVSEGDVRWEKAVGDSVTEDEVVCEIETDKTSVPVPSPGAGVITERFVQDGATVKAGQQLFKIQLGPGGAKPKPAAAPAAKAEAPAAAPPPPTPPSPAASAAAPPPPPPPPPAPKPAGAPPPAAPTSTIPVAAIRHAQAIEAATVKVPPSDPTSEISGTRTEQRVKMNRMRQRIAQRLKDAQSINAMLTTFNELDMSAIIDFRKQNQEAFQKKHGIKLGFMSAFVKAAAYALQDQPVVNAVIDGTDIVYRDYIDISVAVATPKGLVVPVLRNVETMNYADIEKGINALGEKAKKGTLAVEDMDGGTFTISNGGVFGSLMGTPIINPPQSAILGMHATFERPVAIKGQVVIRPMMYIALTYDHRLIDGREAVLFLRKIKAAVEDPRIIVAGLAEEDNWEQLLGLGQLAPSPNFD